LINFASETLVGTGTQFSLENYRNNIQLFAKGRFKPIFRNFVFFRAISEYSWSIVE